MQPTQPKFQFSSVDFCHFVHKILIFKNHSTNSALIPLSARKPLDWSQITYSSQQSLDNARLAILYDDTLPDVKETLSGQYRHCSAD